MSIVIAAQFHHKMEDAFRSVGQSHSSYEIFCNGNGANGFGYPVRIIINNTAVEV
jgi:hypothetical protein